MSANKKKFRINSFRLLWDAMRSSRQPMWISIQVLVVLTLLLATIFYFAESAVQPDEYNYWNSMVWAFTRYIDDPGEFATVAPVTLTGRIIAALIGIVGILLFAVPAGIIGGAFSQSIDDELRKKHLVEVGDRLEKAFRRIQIRGLLYEVIPRYITVGSLVARKHITEKDIIDAVEYNPRFRLKNLADAELEGSHAVDQLIVEYFPLNRDYGVCINRNSNITICCAASVSEVGIGNFGYYLAYIGGFNFISKEIEPRPEDPVSFYIIGDKEIRERQDFLKDLKNLAGKGKDHWTIILIESRSNKKRDFQFLIDANMSTGRISTVIETETFMKFYGKFRFSMLTSYDLSSFLNITLKKAGKKNLGVIIGGGIDTNAFTIRISSAFSAWHPFYIQIAKIFAEILNSSFQNKDTEIPSLIKKSGKGYQGFDQLDDNMNLNKKD